MQGSYYVSFNVQPFEVIGAKVDDPYSKGIVRLSGVQEDVTYKLYRNGEYVTEQKARDSNTEIIFDELVIGGVYTVKGVVGQSEADMFGSFTLYMDLQVFAIEGNKLANNKHEVRVLGAQNGVTYKLYRGGKYIEQKVADQNTSYITFSSLIKSGIYTVRAFLGQDEANMTGSYRIANLSVSRNKNFVMTHTYTSPNSKVSNITYMDGLGREIQSIAINALPQGMDVVSYSIYDAMGRADSVTFLPFTANGDGAYYNNVSSNQRSYYNTKFAGDPDRNYAYAIKQYDNSPLGQVVKQSGPGHANSMSQHPVVFDYRLNTSADKIKKYSFNTLNKTTSYSGYYAANTLTVSSSTKLNLPQNQTATSYEFKDSEGQLVASRVVYGDGENRTTYFVYDDMANQRFVIPPIQEATMVSGTSYSYDQLKNYCYYMEYDKYGNVIKQYVPGMEYVQTIYDIRGRVVMSQSGNLRAEGKWAFTKYDDLDRPVMTGIATGGSYDTHKQAIDNITIFGEERGSALHGYTNRCYPTSVTQNDILTVSYYDDYDWQTNTKYAFSTADALGNKKSTEVVSLPTGSKTKILGTGSDEWLTSVIYYDEKYNAIQTISDLYPVSGLDKETVSNKHDWAGNVVQTKVKQTSGGGIHEYNKWFDYDEGGRLLSIRQNITRDPKGEIMLTSYEYNDLGQMVAKSVHNGLDRTEYEYTLPGAQIAATSDNFSYRIGSEKSVEAGLESRYDGNVAHATWTNSAGESKAYVFDYDKAGQMKTATMFEKNSQAWSATTKFAEKGLTYDKNGNILSLQRTNSLGRTLHNIKYTYTGNQITSLNIGGTATQPYTYDANGNMTYDGHTGVKIYYNVLNLPYQIFDGNNSIRYIYSATGEKLASIVKNRSFTFYRGVMVYVGGVTGNEQLSYIVHPEGIVQYNQNSADSKYTYKYFKTDHLGSTRAVLAALWGDGDYSMQVEQETDYYPFGLAHETNNLAVNKYLFSGKELQDVNIGSLGLLGMYDFGSRYYNPMLGRWFNIDPALQMTNPYIYCGNSPAMYVDPDGEFIFSALAAIFCPPLLAVGVFMDTFAAGNTAAHAIRGDIHNVGDFFKFAGQGAMTGAILGVTWQFAPQLSVFGKFAGGIGKGIRTTMNIYGYAMGGSAVVGMFGGPKNAGMAFLGNFYLDENSSFFGGVWHGISRHTNEMVQNFAGHGYMQFRNLTGDLDRVDYLGGATFGTFYGPGKSSSLGSYININYTGDKRWNSKNFDEFVTSEPLYMHEYGHTIQSRQQGLFYIPKTAIPSAKTVNSNETIDGVSKHRFNSVEMQSNRHAAKYFGKNYGVDWNNYESKYPTIKK